MNFSNLFNISHLFENGTFGLRDCILGGKMISGKAQVHSTCNDGFVQEEEGVNWKSDSRVRIFDGIGFAPKTNMVFRWTDSSREYRVLSVEKDPRNPHWILTIGSKYDG